MKSVFLLWTVFSTIGFGHFASAETLKPFDLQQNTVFEILNQWFDNGENVAFDEVEGIYAGRCYNNEDPSDPENSLLGILDDKGSHDHGPGLPDLTFKKIIQIYLDYGPEDHFDNYTYDNARIELMEFFDRTPLAQTYNGTLTKLYRSGSRREVKRADDFILVAYFKVEEEEVIHGPELEQLCYYFKSL